jgi:ribosome maturation factor RimP
MLEDGWDAMDLAGRIADLIGPTVAAMGFALVRVQVLGRQRIRLQLMIERLDGRPVVLDDCADISRAVSPVLDVADLIADAYTLEVSSPGVDRPLVRLDDYRRFAGMDARIELVRLIDGRRRYQGRLNGVDGDRVRIDCDGSEVTVSFSDIARGKLVLSDALLAGGNRVYEASEQYRHDTKSS